MKQGRALRRCASNSPHSPHLASGSTPSSYPATTTQPPRNCRRRPAPLLFNNAIKGQARAVEVDSTWWIAGYTTICERCICV